MVQEQDVGIVAYANDAPAVEAILRHRYTDFKVSEVGLDMQVARYSGDQLPEQVARPAATFANPEAVKALTDRLREVAGEANAEAFSAYIAQLLARVRICCTLYKVPPQRPQLATSKHCHTAVRI